jgi:hypothetical protein
MRAADGSPTQAAAVSGSQIPPKLERVMNLIKAQETGRGLLLPRPLLQGSAHIEAADIPVRLTRGRGRRRAQ